MQRVWTTFNRSAPLLGWGTAAVAAFAAFQSLRDSISAIRAELGNSVANDPWNNRIIQAFADKHGGTEVGWQSQINMGLQMMKEKMECERMMSEFLDGNLKAPDVLESHSFSILQATRDVWRQ